MQNKKGQLSFDFILALVLFLVIIGFVFAIVNDFESKNNSIVNNLQLYNSYLVLHDKIQSSKYYDGFIMTAKIPVNIEECNIDASVSGEVLTLRGFDSNYVIASYVGSTNESNISCNSEINIR